MSGPVGSEQWMYSSGKDFYPYEVGQSARSKGGALKRFPTTGNNKLFTWSGWVKRSKLGARQSIFVCGAGTNGVKTTAWYFNDSDQLEFKIYFINYNTEGLSTSDAVFRDTSSWYHLTLVYDSNNSVPNDRLRAWVNGERIALSTPGFVKNYASSMNNPTYPIYMLGWQTTYAEGLKGYYAHIDYVDGQGLTPDHFGETKSGVWIPKEYEGTYGTNGCKLDFSNAADLGEDLSGNNNDYEKSGTVDQMPDSPTNNFPTLNPLFRPVSGVVDMDKAALRVTNTGANAWKNSASSMSIPRRGKWYAEFRSGTSGVGIYNMIGITNPISPQFYSGQIGAVNSGVGYYSDTGRKYQPAGDSAYGDPYTAGDIISIAYDADANQVTFYKNNVSQGVISVEDAEYCFGAAVYSSSDNVTCNFGQDSSFSGQKTAQGYTDANGIGDFQYAPPADHLALCSANLPALAIDPVRDDIPADYFNPVLYAGNGSTQSITGVGFQPDFTWIKKRSGGALRDHSVYDSVRGEGRYLRTNSTAAEAGPFSTTVLLDLADGFSLGNFNDTNEGGSSYAAWNWKAGGTTVANTDGTIASQVSANQKAGFSVVTYTGDGATTTTIGHGLSKAPELFIVKNRTAASTSWMVYSNQIPSDHYLILDGTNASGAAGLWGSGPTSSVITLTYNPQTNWNAEDFVAYCFHSVEGFSKFGSYVGNGSADGPFVYTGFRPAYVMQKRVDSTGGWGIHDSKRDPSNLVTQYLNAESTAAEASATFFDLTSNGFKMRDGAIQNVGGATYIYIAFAEQPFKYANAR